MSRIGIIREAIVAEGGRSIPFTYADSTHGWADKAIDGVHKVPVWYDGLTQDARDRVIVELNKREDVKLAYLSRGDGHIKVRFYGLLHWSAQ